MGRGLRGIHTTRGFFERHSSWRSSEAPKMHDYGGEEMDAINSPRASGDITHRIGWIWLFWDFCLSFLVFCRDSSSIQLYIKLLPFSAMDSIAHLSTCTGLNTVLKINLDWTGPLKTAKGYYWILQGKSQSQEGYNSFNPNLNPVILQVLWSALSQHN